MSLDFAGGSDPVASACGVRLVIPFLVFSVMESRSLSSSKPSTISSIIASMRAMTQSLSKLSNR
jgi:hypothetical protein